MTARFAAVLVLGVCACTWRIGFDPPTRGDSPTAGDTRPTGDNRVGDSQPGDTAQGDSAGADATLLVPTSVDVGTSNGCCPGPGGLLDLTLTPNTLQPTFAGNPFVLSTTAGCFETAGRCAASITLSFTAAGALPDLQLRVSLDVAPGTLVNLFSNLVLTGTTSFTVTGLIYTPTPIGTATIAADPMLRVTNAAVTTPFDPAMLEPVGSGGLETMMYPPAGSSFGSEPIIGIRDDSPGPRLLQLTSAGLQPLASSDGVNGPDSGTDQLAITPPGHPYGEAIFVCASSSGGGDGIFTVDVAGVFAPWDTFNNCGGIAFDFTGMLGNLTEQLYVQRAPGNSVLDQYASDASSVTVQPDLTFTNSGDELFFQGAGTWGPKLWLINGGNGSGAGDGLIRTISTLTPTDDLANFVLNLPKPQGAIFTEEGRWGTLLITGFEDSGELVGYRPDASRILIASGFVQIKHVIMSPDGRTIRVLDRGIPAIVDIQLR